MCRRTTADPLVRAFLDRYGLNLLEIPREHAAVGDLYAVHGGRVLPPGPLSKFLEPSPRLPEPTVEELAELSATISDAVAVKAGLGLLEGFLAALGAAGIVNRVRAHYATSGARTLRFRISDAIRRSVNPVEIGSVLRGCRPLEDHPLAAEGYRYYVSIGVVQTRSLNVISDASGEQGGGLDVETPVAEASASVTVERVGRSEIRYQGEKALAIGVELVEIEFDRDNDRVRFRAPNDPLRLRQGLDVTPEPTFIGPPDGDAFVAIG